MRLSRPENLWSATERGETVLAAAPPSGESGEQAAGPELPSARGWGALTDRLSPLLLFLLLLLLLLQPVAPVERPPPRHGSRGTAAGGAPVARARRSARANQPPSRSANRRSLDRPAPATTLTNGERGNAPRPALPGKSVLPSARIGCSGVAKGGSSSSAARGSEPQPMMGDLSVPAPRL